MTNETTASQPKSIGDDAQFMTLLNEANYTASEASVCGNDFGTGDKAQTAENALIAYIDSRAPAAQASATIQAAPEDDRALRAGRNMMDYAKRAGWPDDGEGAFEFLQRTFYEAGAATIQEPVMVAERTPNSSDPRDEAHAAGWNACLAAIRLAAPMVADPAGVAVPIPMILFCPKCGKQHIDAPDAHKFPAFGPGMDVAPWTNPPHRSHLCHGCGNIWRPADVATEGVAAIKTVGSNDSVATTVKAVPSEARIANLEAALRYYAEGNHFTLSDPDAWDTVSGEPFNFQCDEAGTAMVEDGSIAKMVLAGEPMPKDDEEIAVAIPKSEGADAAPLADKTGGVQ